MNPLRRRINQIFGLLCVPVGILYLMSFFMNFFAALREMGLPLSDYAFDFVIPQTVYPLLNLLLAAVALMALSPQKRLKGLIRRPSKDFFPWLGFFLGAVTLGNLVNNYLTFLFERLLGTDLPAVFSEDNPTSLWQGIFFFIVVAVLPSVSEEFLFRGFGCGGLSDYHPLGAVVLSAYAFGMMHATLQQIPFAIFMGLIFGLVYLRTGNLIYPILLHFVNNAWACTTTFVEIAFGEGVSSMMYWAGSLVFLYVGEVSFLRLRKNGLLSLAKPSEAPGAEPLWKTVLTSPGFWGFTVLYGLLTVLNLCM